VHEFVVFTSFLILFCCKSSKTFFKNINSKRIVTSDHNVDSKIKFKSINEKRVINVSRNDMFIINFKL